MASHMRTTMARQPADLRALLADPDPVAAAAGRLAGRGIVLVGTGTSWHAANHGAWLLALAGVEARAVPAFDAALYGAGPRPGDALVVLSHTGATRYALTVLERARADGVPAVLIAGRGAAGADLETVEQERSSAYTASHLGALARLAQLARALGGDVGPLEGVPDAVAAALDGPGPGVTAPPRLLELTGAGPNQWTAAEGALKVRETCRVATEGLAVEQLFQGPAVALDERDALVALDGGGPGAQRLAAVADAAQASGVRIHRIAATELGEPLSVFPLTVAVQRIALELAEALGTDPDAFGFDVPGRRETWEPLGF